MNVEMIRIQIALKRTSYKATRSDGRKVKISGVYFWKRDKHERFEPHCLTQFIKLLRNAYNSSPEYGQQLYNQLDFLIYKSISRNGATVWENNEGYSTGHGAR